MRASARPLFASRASSSWIPLAGVKSTGTSAMITVGKRLHREVCRGFRVAIGIDGNADKVPRELDHALVGPRFPVHLFAGPAPGGAEFQQQGLGGFLCELRSPIEAGYPFDVGFLAGISERCARQEELRHSIPERVRPDQKSDVE